MNKPAPTNGLRHLALTVQALEDCVYFYRDLMGMTIEWQPDADNIYLTSGNDNLALHRATKDFHADKKNQYLHHLGFIIKTKEDVTHWYDYLKSKQIKMLTEVKHHRDGAVSFYCEDPEGNAVQMLYHPPLCAL